METMESRGEERRKRTMGEGIGGLFFIPLIFWVERD
jgi:hypothetical protein